MTQECPDLVTFRCNYAPRLLNLAAGLERPKQAPPEIVMPTEVKAIHDQAVTGLMPAFDRSDFHHAKDWIDRCAADLAQLWRFPEMWAVTDVQDGKSGRLLHIVAVAGKWSDAHLSRMEQWGKSMGCSAVYATGRPGWARLIKDAQVKTITIKKDL